MVIREINSRENYDEFLGMDKDALVVIKFGAAWCGPCRVLSGTLKSLDDNKINGALFGTVEIGEDDWSDGLASELGIRNIPVLIYYKNGVEIKRTVGLSTADAIYKAIEELS